MSLFLWMVVGSVIGGAGYAVSAYRKGSGWGCIAGEAFFSGGFFAGALHLVLCSFFLEQLCEIRYEDGREFHQAGVHVAIDSLHRFEIFVGGVLAAIGSGRAVLSAWKKP